MAEQPLSILGKVKSGTVSPEDMKTMNALYPHLTNSLNNKTFEAMVEHKTAGKEISRKKKAGLSHLMGQPLDFTQTTQAMQAIIHANVPAQASPSQQKKSGATAATLKTIKEADDLYKTPEDSRVAAKQKS